MRFFRAGLGGLTNKMAEKALVCKTNHESSLLLNEIDYKNTPRPKNCEGGTSRAAHPYQHFGLMKFWIPVRTMPNCSVANWYFSFYAFLC